MRHNVFFRATILLVLFVLSGSPQAAATAPGADPAINRAYLDADYQRWVSRFERAGREVYDRRQDIVEAVRPEKGMTIADIGAGTGLFTRLFASRVGPQGRVVAVDISAEFIENILRGTRQQGLDNVQGVVNSQQSTGLPSASVDLAFVCDTYHHFEQPRAMLRSIHQALRPGGELVIIDFRRTPGISGPWIMGHVRGDRESTVRDLEQAGIRLTYAPNL